MISFTAHKDAAVDYDGAEIKEFNSTFDSPFVPWLSGGIVKILLGYLSWTVWYL